jgi:hypothetical protein
VQDVEEQSGAVGGRDGSAEWPRASNDICESTASGAASAGRARVVGVKPVRSLQSGCSTPNRRAHRVGTGICSWDAGLDGVRGVLWEEGLSDAGG